MMACVGGHLDIAMYLVDERLDVNAKTEVIFNMKLNLSCNDNYYFLQIEWMDITYALML